MRRVLFFLACWLCVAAGVYGQNIVGYTNLTTFGGQAFSNGQSANQTGNQITRMIADDIQAAPAAWGLPVVGIRFSVTNLNSAAVSVRPRIRFYDNNGAGGLPGTFLAGFSFNPISFNAGTATTVSATIGIGSFSLPADGSFWAGIVYDNNTGATGATQAQMDLFGMGLYNPPTIGSSTDTFFVTTAAGSFLASNPAGSTTSFGGSPLANFGWEFTVAVPEPSTWAMIGLSAAGALGGVWNYRRRRALAMDAQLR